MKKLITAAAIGVGTVATLWAPAAHAQPQDLDWEPAPTKPSISISDPSITEGNAGTKQLSFGVKLSKASDQMVKATAQTIGAVSNPATANVDYVSKVGFVTFNPGVTFQIFSVTIKGDTQFEANEKFGVSLSNVSNATIGKQNGAGTITNDDFLVAEPQPPKPQPQPQPQPEPEPDDDDKPAEQPKPNGGSSGGGSTGGGTSGGGTAIGSTDEPTVTTAAPADDASGEQALSLDGATDVAPEDGSNLATWLLIVAALATGAVVLFMLLSPRRRQRA
jgi:hypothetical protein